ncbi:MAG: DNA polymerase III subunit delta', partial [Sneathiella sp.]
MSDLPVADKLENYPHPKETEELVGQSHAENAFLENYNSGRFHHAWLITGATGAGKATFAYRAA